MLYGKGGRWIIPEIRGGWVVSVVPTANGQRLIRELPTFLGVLEAAGRRSLDSCDEHPKDVNARYAKGLGIVHADQVDTAYPGSVYPVVELIGERSGGMVARTADAVATWIGRFLRSQRADVLTKLDRSVLRSGTLS